MPPAAEPSHPADGSPVTQGPSGRSLLIAGRAAEAVAALRDELARRPDDPANLNDLGVALLALRQDAGAVVCFSRALLLRPDDVAMLGNLATVLRRMDRLPEAERVGRRALALEPAHLGSRNNLAATLHAQDRPHEALATLEAAMELDPDDPETNHNRAMILLLLGRLEEAWPHYDHRFLKWRDTAHYAWLAGADPWRGEPLEGRTILIEVEQGLGDVIHFARYAPLVAARGGRVVLRVWEPLERLMRSLPGVDEVVVATADVPVHDVHCPYLSLPRAFGTTLDTIPAAVPYLFAEAEAGERWAGRIGKEGADLNVGLVWAGSPQHSRDRQRSPPFDALSPLWAVDGVRWFSLQVGHRASDLRDAADEVRDRVVDLAPDLTDFAETAAAIAGLDLVISIDTAVAHLAGALARDIWVMLPSSPDWRWLREGNRSPWYPTMRLFRQTRDGDWGAVVASVAKALAERANGAPGARRAPRP